MADKFIKCEDALVIMEAQRERIKKQMDEALAYEHFHTRSDLKCALSQLEDDMYLIEHIQAADVAPVVRGRWMWDGGEDMHYYCSHCHHNAYGCTTEILDGTYHYCPNCGAKMEVQQ